MSGAARFLDDPNLRFPRRPHLAPDLIVFEMPDGLGIQIRGGEADVLLRGNLAQTVIPWLVSRLDGKTSVEEILASRPPGVSPADAADALLLLLRKGALVDAAESAAREPGPTLDRLLDRQRLFFGRKLGVTRALTTADAAQRALATARVVLVGNGLFGAASFDLLQRSGCGEIAVLDWEGEGLLLEAAGGAPRDGCCVSAEPLDGDLERLGARMASLLPGADMLLTATRLAPDAVFLLLNERVLLQRARWLRGNETPSEIEIGPYVNGSDSACYTCLVLRTRGVAPFPLEEQLYQEDLARHGPRGAAGESIAHATAGAALLVSEATRVLCGIAPPQTEGALLALSFEHGLSRHGFARVPRCPDCHRGDVGTSLEPD